MRLSWSRITIKPESASICGESRARSEWASYPICGSSSKMRRPRVSVVRELSNDRPSKTARRLLLWAVIASAYRSDRHGKVWQESARRSGEGDSQDQTRQTKERQEGKGQEPQAGHRHWPLEGAEEGGEGAAQKENKIEEELARLHSECACYLEIGQHEPTDAVAKAAPQ